MFSFMPNYNPAPIQKNYNPASIPLGLSSFLIRARQQALENLKGVPPSDNVTTPDTVGSVVPGLESTTTDATTTPATSTPLVQPNPAYGQTTPLKTLTPFRGVRGFRFF